MARQVELSIEAGDITTFAADALVLKHAQAFHGADELVRGRLERVGVGLDELQVEAGEYKVVASRGAVAAPQTVWLGIPRLWRMTYAEVLSIGARALEALKRSLPTCRSVALTTHGPGVGLDEVEATLSLIAGLRSAVHSGNVPETLERITIVERNRRRVDNLHTSVPAYLADDKRVVPIEGRWAYLLEVGDDASSAPASVPPSKIAGDPHAFIAMPFLKDMEDVFYYGIQAPVRRAGLLCERIDEAVFMGDILARILSRIETASVVIADLTGHNPNVYLEVGYAWAKKRPTILLVRDPKELRFDVQNQRCIIYDNIRNLEEQLERELAHHLG